MPAWRWTHKTRVSLITFTCELLNCQSHNLTPRSTGCSDLIVEYWSFSQNKWFLSLNYWCLYWIAVVVWLVKMQPNISKQGLSRHCLVLVSWNYWSIKFESTIVLHPYGNRYLFVVIIHPLQLQDGGQANSIVLILCKNIFLSYLKLIRYPLDLIYSVCQLKINVGIYWEYIRKVFLLVTLNSRKR